MADFVSVAQAYPYGTTYVVNTATSPQTSLRIGSQAITGDGRKFRFASAGGADLVVGNALQAAAPVANHQACAVQAAAAVGATQVSVTLGATLATVNQYAGGYLSITATPGNGWTYQILSHPAAALSTTLVLTLAEPVQVALTTSSTASLTPSLFAGVIQSPVTTLTGAIVGGCASLITATNAGWIQTCGMFNGLIVGTPAVGAALSCPTTAAGAFAINSGTLPVVAEAMVVGVDGANKPIYLLLD